MVVLACLGNVADLGACVFARRRDLVGVEAGVLGSSERRKSGDESNLCEEHGEVFGLFLAFYFGRSERVWVGREIEVTEMVEGVKGMRKIPDRLSTPTLILGLSFETKRLGPTMIARGIWSAARSNRRIRAA